MLIQVQRLPGEFAPEAMHCELETRVVPVHCLEKLADLYGCIQLLVYFALQGLLRAFPGFNLPTGELPPILEFPISALRCKNLVTAPYHRSCHFYVFHNEFYLFLLKGKESAILRIVSPDQSSSISMMPMIS